MSRERIERFWSPAFDDMKDFVFLIDGEFKIAKCNQSFLAATKRSKESVEENTCYACVHSREEPIHDCPHQRLLKSKRYEEGEIYEPELDMWLYVRTTPIFEPSGELLGSIHIASDITAVKRADEKLKENMNRVKQINDMLVAREQRIIEMKAEVNGLLEELGRDPKYDFADK